MSIPENMKVLPTPYSIPEIHKSPIGTRFVIGGKQYVIEPLSKNFTSTFKLLYKRVKNMIKASFTPKLGYLGESK